MGRRWRIPLCIGVLLGFVLFPAAANADRRNDAREDLIARQRALVEELDALRASDEALTEAIEILDLYIALQMEDVSQAQDGLAEAMVAATRARVAEAEQQAKVEELEGRMADMAIAAYVAPPQADHMETMLAASAPAEAARLSVYLDVQNHRDTDLVRRLRQARALLSHDRNAAEAAEARAAAAHETSAQQLSDLLAAQLQQMELQEEVQTRAAEASYESALVGLEIGRTNQAVLAAARQIGGANVPLVSVRGIRVHRSIASQLEGLLAAAEAAEIPLHGGGHRSNGEQIFLRHAHCGSDHYSVWEKPAGECSPPTARPGTSLHELGLAIDFTHRGAVIGSHSDPAFIWLAENAAAFGFYNLPSEPWHWSISGQ